MRGRGLCDEVGWDHDVRGWGVRNNGRVGLVGR